MTGGSLAARSLYPEVRQTRPERLPRSPVIGTDSPVQYEPSDAPGVRRRLPAGGRDRRPARRPRRPRRPSRRPRRRPVQTPAPFEYERATSVDGAIASLQRLGPDARIIAGGHSLLPMMKLRLANPAHLIDINDLPELAYIREEGRDPAIGAMTRHVDLLELRAAGRALPGVPRRRAGHRRPGRAQPRHDRRLALPGRRGRGPLRRLLGASKANVVIRGAERAASAQRMRRERTCRSASSTSARS